MSVPDQGEIRAGELQRGIESLASDARNLLALLGTYAEALEERYDEEAFRAEFRAFVEAAVGRVDNALERLHRLTLLGSARPESIDLPALLKALLRRRSDEFAGHALIVLRELDHELPPVWGDRNLLGEAFDSLLSCVAAVAPRYGDVYVSAREEIEGRGSWGVTALLRFRLDKKWGEQTEPAGLALASALFRAQGASLEIEVEEELYLSIVIVLPLAIES